MNTHCNSIECQLNANSHSSLSIGARHSPAHRENSTLRVTSSYSHRAIHVERFHIELFVLNYFLHIYFELFTLNASVRLFISHLNERAANDRTFLSGKRTAIKAHQRLNSSDIELGRCKCRSECWSRMCGSQCGSESGSESGSQFCFECESTLEILLKSYCRVRNAQERERCLHTASLIHCTNS